MANNTLKYICILVKQVFFNDIFAKSYFFTFIDFIIFPLPINQKTYIFYFFQVESNKMPNKKYLNVTTSWTESGHTRIHLFPLKIMLSHFFQFSYSWIKLVASSKSCFIQKLLCPKVGSSKVASSKSYFVQKLLRPKVASPKSYFVQKLLRPKVPSSKSCFVQ